MSRSLLKVPTESSSAVSMEESSITEVQPQLKTMSLIVDFLLIAGELCNRETISDYKLKTLLSK